MAPATLAQPQMVELMSVYEKHRVGLESPEEVISAQHGKYRIPGSGKEISFSNHRASIPAEWMPLLEAHREQLIQRGLVGTVEGFTRIPEVGTGVQVGAGAQAAGTNRAAMAPRPGWDEATGRQINEWIAAKAIPSVETALTYELAHRRRKMVVRALTEAVLGDDPAPGPEPGEEPEPVAALMSVPVPEGIGGGEL